MAHQSPEDGSSCGNRLLAQGLATSPAASATAPHSASQQNLLVCLQLAADCLMVMCSHCVCLFPEQQLQVCSTSKDVEHTSCSGKRQTQRDVEHTCCSRKSQTQHGVVSDSFPSIRHVQHAAAQAHLLVFLAADCLIVMCSQCVCLSPEQQICSTSWMP